MIYISNSVFLHFFNWLDVIMVLHMLYWSLVTHTCFSELGHHWFRLWLFTCWAPSRYLNQCWLICSTFYLNGRIQYYSLLKILLKTLPFLAVTICINTLRPRQNGRHFPDDIFKCIFLENIWISIQISLKFVPKGPINNIPALVQVMAWRRPGDKPLSDSMMVKFTDAYMRHSASMS